MERGNKKTKDNGRRALIIVGAHISLLVCGGTYRSCGIFLVEWRRYFDVSLTAVSAVLSTIAAVMLLSGFLVGPVIHRFGCHIASLLGAIFFMCGSITSVFAPNTTVLCITFGLFSGFGLGLTYNAAQVVVAENFKKGYSRANSVVSSGVGVGLIVLPPIFQGCIDYYGWRGTMLILAGIQAQLVVCALLLRPLKKRMSASRKKSGAEDGDEGNVASLEPLTEDGCKRICNDGEIGNMDEAVNTVGSSNDVGANKQCPSSSDMTKENCIYMYRNGSVQYNQNASLNGACTHSFKCKQPETGSFSRSEGSVDGSCISNRREDVIQELQGDDCEGIREVSCPLMEQEAMSERTTLSSVRGTEQELNGESTPLKDTGLSNFLANEGGNKNSCAKDNQRSSTPEQRSLIYRLLKSSGLTLFGESMGFCIIILLQLSISICYTGIMSHFVASAVYEGIDPQSASLLLSALGVASLLGRLGNGWLIDHKVIGAERLFMLAMAIFGGCTVLSRASNAYGWYVFLALVFGASSGVFKCVLPVVLRNYVGVENLAPAMGIAMVFMGVGDLVGPVFAGALYDASNSYSAPFYVTGTLLMVSSSLVCLEPPLRRRRERHRAIKTRDAEKGYDINESDVEQKEK